MASSAVVEAIVRLEESYPLNPRRERIYPTYESLEDFLRDASRFSGVPLKESDLLESLHDIRSMSNGGSALALTIWCTYLSNKIIELAIRPKDFIYSRPYQKNGYENIHGDAPCLVTIELRVECENTISSYFCRGVESSLKVDKGKRVNPIDEDNNKIDYQCDCLRIELVEPLADDPNAEAFNILRKVGRTSIASFRLVIDFPGHQQCCNQIYEDKDPFGGDPKPMVGKELLERLEELQDMSKKEQAIACGYYYLFDDGTKQADLPSWAAAKKEAVDDNA